MRATDGGAVAWASEEPRIFHPFSREHSRTTVPGDTDGHGSRYNSQAKEESQPEKLQRMTHRQRGGELRGSEWTGTDDRFSRA